MGREGVSALVVALLIWCCRCEQVRVLQVSEGSPVGVRVGYIGDGSSSPPYLIVPVPGSAVDTDLAIESETGEIRTKVRLDRETRSSYSLVAIPRSGGNIRVLVNVLDENDNAPTFPSPTMEIEFPENTPRDVKRTLNPARDPDLDVFNTQRYNIVSGNYNNAFRLSSHREKDGVLYLDLQINGFLDRETTSEYSLVIEALDGGTPPLRGRMTVNITIQDVNDNQPIFNQSRYIAAVPENATLGTSVLQVFATDTDSGENGRIEYSINRRQSDRDLMFQIDSKTGVITVNRPLDFETKEIHELVIVAKDLGAQPLETTAFVSIRVTDVNDNQPTINVIFLSDDATPKISEMAQKGEFVARISVNDPDSKTEYSNVNVTLEGGEGHFGLATQDNIIYLVIVSMPLDRELKSNYTLSVIATDTGTPPLHASRTFHLRVTDVNDNPPEFSPPSYSANVVEIADPGTSVVQIFAADPDEGENSLISYSILEDVTSHHPPWFQIDSKSGLITTKTHIDCETDPVPRIIVIATDSGTPPLSSSATVLVTIHDVNDNEPIFDHSFYNVTIAENEPKGTCILKDVVLMRYIILEPVDQSLFGLLNELTYQTQVSATDPDCGVNAMVNYTIGETKERVSQLTINQVTGEICIVAPLDFETKPIFEFPVIATDRGGLSTRAIVRIQLTDVNDNSPVFYPKEYNVSLKEGASGGPLVTVAATDSDSGRFGSLTYSIASGNPSSAFSINAKTGEIKLIRPDALNPRSPSYRLNVTAVDGGGLRSDQDAQVHVSLLDSRSVPVQFQSARYDMSIREDAPPNTVVGSVKAISSDPRAKHLMRYSISSGDPDGYFTIDPTTGYLHTSARLDHETHSSLLLNVQATSGSPPVYGHTQVHIEIEDVNDNPPTFAASKVRISVRESEVSGTALYTAHAEDRDDGIYGRVVYLLATGGHHFRVDAKTGDLYLKVPLDYELSQRHTVVVSAADGGSPPLTSNLTVLLEVQDVNDNPPVFERAEYTVPVIESLPVNSQVVQVTAVDLDTGNNARLTYKLLSGEDVFGMFPNSGWLYLKGKLDRETRDRYSLRVLAEDNGTPSSTATAVVTVVVTDANDNDPVFTSDVFEFSVEENQPKDAVVGRIRAVDADLDLNAVITYSFVPANSSFQINPYNGEITTREELDREVRALYELVAEARDGGTPPRSTRSTVRIIVSDVNDNSPEIVDPQEDVVSIREEQAPGTEVVKVRAVDRDNGPNATITYSILKGREGDGWRVFSVDPVSGILRTRIGLDAGEKDIYRVTVAATDSGTPPRQSVRTLSVEVMALYDHRPTFSSSSLHFKVSEDVGVGYVVGNVVGRDGAQATLMSARARAGHLMYSLTSISPSDQETSFDLDRSSGSLVVTRNLDRESCSEYRLEVRALDTSTTINHQSSAVIIKVEVTDVNDNTPLWDHELVNLEVSEDQAIGYPIYNFSATDADAAPNGDIRYNLVKMFPDDGKFSLDPLTGSLILQSPLDFEQITEYIVVIRATDQSINVSQRLSSSLTAKIKVRDVNDNAPEFVLPISKTILVKEGTEMGETIAKVLAVDKDSGEYGRIAYVISSSNAVGKISLGYETGILSVMQPLLPHSKYNINITASDHASPPKTGMISLTIEVMDVAEAPPTFSQDAYTANVLEDATVGTYVTKIEAKSSSEGNQNVTYSLTSEAFNIDLYSGVVRVSGSLDRETRSSYSLVVYAAEGDHFSATTLTVWIGDVNDHAPRFPACYSLRIPENSEFGVIHRLQAVDMDSGPNAEITYTIAGGNIGNRFSIDLHSGELSARSLDRESQAKYRLVIMAHDKGDPTLSGTCNLTVVVEDQNDNDPVFSKPVYTGRVPEDTRVGTMVLNVVATDQDQYLNARITYSLANESEALFRIDPNSGQVFTTGAFDREKKSFYVFQVVATDSGRYDTRSEKVPIHITIDDVNDNKPVFSQYPFTAIVPVYTPSGKELLRVLATDGDEGANSDIVFSFQNEPSNNKFRIDPKSGAVTATSSLAMDSGKMYHLEVVATDRGNPPQSSNCLVEITIGEVPDHVPTLRFQNSSYSIQLHENPSSGTEVVQVSAVRTDGRRHQISYRLVAGNENGFFFINPQTGMIRVSGSGSLDYETSPEINMTVQALGESTGSGPLHGYAQVRINLQDLNDNPPMFSQAQYSTTVWEGNSKGTFVMQVSATDKDQGSNSQLLYHIVDGNHDNAFIIEPSSSGIVKVNIVLDREIRDNYRLTVIATDEGVPQLTGTSTILVDIVDVNDNQPTFPPPSVVTVNEGKEVGSVLTTVTANDVDTNPALTYNISYADGSFAIDRFSGKVTLCQKLDFESKKEFKIGITASDTTHIAHTHLTILVADDNDNSPFFTQPFYQTVIPDTLDGAHSTLTVSASDLDSEKNARITYSFVNMIQGFDINPTTGEIVTNLTALDAPRDNLRTIDLMVSATDSGKPPLSSVVPVRIRLGLHGSRKSAALQKEFKLSVKESTPYGTSLLRITGASKTEEMSGTAFNIVEGNLNGTFEILGPQGDLVLVKPLDREMVDLYSLKAVRWSDSASSTMIYITVEDSNDNAPQFEQLEHSVSLFEDVLIGSSVLHLRSFDGDLPPNSDVSYDIISGNDEQLFRIDPHSGLISVSNKLDYDVGFSTYSLVVSATDKAVPPEHPLCSIAAIEISLKDSNDNSPNFPVIEYLEFVGENEPIGSTVFTARATDMDRGIFGRLNYSIETSVNMDVEETWKLFRVDPLTGLVTTNSVFDYETRSRYAFTLIAMDYGAKLSKVRVRIEIESRDEFYPQFTERTYRFAITDKDLPVGYVVGNVLATDRDKGPDGRIVYQLTNQHPYFKVNRTTGAVMIKKKIDSNLNIKQEVSFVVRASSGRQESLTNMTVVEISFDPLASHETNLVKLEDGSNNTALATSTSKVADWAMGLLISLIIVILCFGAVFLFLHMRNRRQKNGNKPGLDSVQSADNYVDPGAFDTIPVRGGIAGPASQFGPPKYEEIPTYRNNKSNSSTSAAAPSQISGSDQSGSSGRGSAEDGDDVEDEEIRMINEGIQRDSVLHRSSDDNMSDVSVQNTKEYLARLGIVNSGGSSGNSRRRTDSVGAGSSKDIMLHTTVPMDGLRMFDEDATAEAEITNLIYAKLADVGGSDRVNNAEEGSGSTTGTVIGAAVDHVIGIGPYGGVQGTHQPSMTGSLSSIVHSEEELTGSYNWDYLLDWGPQYQPLAHVFSEIARLKDDAASVKSGTSGTSSGKGKGPLPIKSVPPPLLTSVAPRSIAAPILSSRGGHHPPLQHQSSKMHLMPRSPINHDTPGAVYGPAGPMSPSFSPALSPLATSPSLSPMVTPRHPSSHHVRQRKTDAELRI